MTAPFSNKVIAITGGASGIGLATAQLLASRGALLSLADQNTSLLETAAALIKSQTPNASVLTFSLDVRNVAQVDEWIATTVKQYGRLDGAVNLAGVIGKSIGILGVKDIDQEEWDFILGINLTGVMNCLRAELRVIQAGGSIVSASSVAGIRGRAYNAAYTASKHGVIGLTTSAAREVGSVGTRVNAICP
jgi:NAD(P)-dependent dehydrogenase (short-subunit alcohol dehydrogenase family)